MNENYNINKKNTKFNVCSYRSHVHTLPKKTTWLKSSYKTSICYCFKCWFIGEKLIRKFSVLSLISAFNHPNFFRQKVREKQSQNQIITSSQQIYSLPPILFIYTSNTPGGRRWRRCTFILHAISPSTLIMWNKLSLWKCDKKWSPHNHLELNS